MATADEVRGAQRATWDRLAASWERWDAVIGEQLRPVAEAMVDRLGIAADQQHLDIASGTGEPGLTVARLAPAGRVVLTDLSPQMLEVAARRTAAAGLTNVETQVCSADDLPFDDASFDTVSVRFGYMFFPDAARATAELVRVLRPGGRLCTSVWVDPERNPWTSVTMRAIGAEVALPPPDPDGPHMFRYAVPGAVGAVYEQAGLVDVAEWDVEVELVTRSPQEYWQMMSEHVSLAQAALARADDAARERIARAVTAAVAAFETGGRVRVPGLARCAVGTRPA